MSAIELKRHRRTRRAVLGVVAFLLAGCVVPVVVPVTSTDLGTATPSPTAIPSDNGDSGNGNSNSASTPQTFATCEALGEPTDEQYREMLDLLNTYREENGLGTLEYSLTLQQAAEDYAERMAREDFYSHYAPDGASPSDRALAAGFCSEYVGENLANGLNDSTTAERAIEMWKGSPGHNENMLRPEWAYVGFGFWQESTALGTEFWWVQLFGQDITP